MEWDKKIPLFEYISIAKEHMSGGKVIPKIFFSASLFISAEVSLFKTHLNRFDVFLKVMSFPFLHREKGGKLFG